MTSRPHSSDEPTPPHGWSSSEARWRSRSPTHPNEAYPDRGRPDAGRPRRPRPLRAVPDPHGTPGPRTGAFGQPIGRHRPSALRRLVEVARVLTGGLMVLAVVVVLVPPLLLSAVGPGVETVVGHLAAAAAALVATGVAASPRTPPGMATVAALVAPVVLLALLWLVWWA